MSGLDDPRDLCVTFEENKRMFGEGRDFGLIEMEEENGDYVSHIDPLENAEDVWEWLEAARPRKLSRYEKQRKKAGDRLLRRYDLVDP